MTLTHKLIVAATLVESVLAGTNVNRALVEMPAWQRTGPLGWAAFSRHADVSIRAGILYPVAAFVGLILSTAAAVSFRRHGSAPRAAAVPLYGAALLGAAGLVTTAKAAPNMLAVRRLDGDTARLQKAMDGFQFWGNVRGLFQVLAFAGNVWSLSAIAASRADVTTPTSL